MISLERQACVKDPALPDTAPDRRQAGTPPAPPKAAGIFCYVHLADDPEVFDCIDQLNQAPAGPAKAKAEKEIKQYLLADLVATPATDRSKEIQMKAELKEFNPEPLLRKLPPQRAPAVVRQRPEAKPVKPKPVDPIDPIDPIDPNQRAKEITLQSLEETISTMADCPILQKYVQRRDDILNGKEQIKARHKQSPALTK